MHVNRVQINKKLFTNIIVTNNLMFHPDLFSPSYRCCLIDIIFFGNSSSCNHKLPVFKMLVGIKNAAAISQHFSGSVSREKTFFQN